MIVEAILNVLAFLLLGVIGLFPKLPQVDTSNLDGVIRVVSLVDTFVSLKVVSACLGLIFLFMNLQTVWSIVMWVVRKIPGIK